MLNKLSLNNKVTYSTTLFTRRGMALDPVSFKT